MLLTIYLTFLSFGIGCGPVLFSSVCGHIPVLIKIISIELVIGPTQRAAGFSRERVTSNPILLNPEREQWNTEYRSFGPLIEHPGRETCLKGPSPFISPTRLGLGSNVVFARMSPVIVSPAEKSRRFSVSQIHAGIMMSKQLTHCNWHYECKEYPNTFTAVPNYLSLQRHLSKNDRASISQHRSSYEWGSVGITLL